MRKRIYIAGPISQGDKKHNLKQAVEAAINLIRLGYAPLCPQLSMEIEERGGVFEHQTWMDVDLPWVKVSHAVLRLPGPSKGADTETEFAKTGQGIPVYRSLSALLRGAPP